MATRVARHLAAVALRGPDGRAVARISHQRLADAVGTVREVISRQLNGLRTDGVIETQPGRVILVDEDRLEDIAAGRVTPSTNGGAGAIDGSSPRA
jgi:CRP/FNR family transcriptional regulator